MLEADSLPTQRKDSCSQSQSQLFLTIEDELRDARRVQSHGLEEDLRQALQMVINRVSELSTKLKEVYKDQAELETSLNLAKSNLQLVQSNNEMLEEALKRDTSGSKDVGWRRASAREAEHRFADDMPRNSDHNHDYRRADHSPAFFTPPVSSRSATSLFSPASGQDSRFFNKFRFANGLSPRPTTPNTMSPTVNGYAQLSHLTSPSLPSLPSHLNREVEELNAELQRERASRKAVLKEKADLEAEIESLSQALFEEANKMVATERIRRAETEEELKETRLEKEALRSALRVIEGENGRLRSAMTVAEEPIPSTQFSSQSHSRSSSRTAIKSRPPSVSSIPSSAESFKFSLETPAPASVSSPHESSESTSTLVDSPAEELTPQETMKFPSPGVGHQRRVFADTKRKPESLQPASLFPTA